MTDELFKRRSISECMGDAWTLLSTNIMRVIKAVWIPALLLAAASALVSGFSARRVIYASSSDTNFTEIITMFAGMCVFMLIAIYINARIYKLLNEQDFKFCLNRSSKVMSFIFGFILVSTIIYSCITVVAIYAGQNGSMPAIAMKAAYPAALFLITVLILVFISPLSYVFTKYLIEPEIKLHDTWKNYKTAFKSLGFIITFVLLCCLILVISYCVTAMPALITVLAVTYAKAGIANGDSSGLPENFHLIYALTTFITSFIATTLNVWFIFTQYYLYATIEAKNGRTDEISTKA